MLGIIRQGDEYLTRWATKVFTRLEWPHLHEACILRGSLSHPRSHCNENPEASKLFLPIEVADDTKSQDTKKTVLTLLRSPDDSKHTSKSRQFRRDWLPLAAHLAGR